jgi:hypothetical protein
VLITIVISTCKKYDEGGWSNVAIKHLFGNNKDGSQKVWHFKSYQVNGIDSTWFILSGNGVTQFQNDEITFKINSARNHDYFMISKVHNYGFYFSDKKRTLNTGNPQAEQCLQNVCERNIFLPEFETKICEWKIIKLTNKTFIVEGNFNKHYKLILIN